MDAEDLSDLVGSIYDAALDPTRWRDVLSACTRFASGQASGIFTKDLSRETFSVHYDDGGISDHYTNLYGSTYSKIDPSTAGQFFAQVGEVVSTADLMPYDEFAESRIYKEWVKPQRLVDTALVVLDRHGDTGVFFIVFRNESQGQVDDEMRRRVRLIAPHIRRAALIGEIIEQKTVASGHLAESLDALRAGFFLVTAQGAIRHSNASGLDMLREAGLLRSSQGRLAVNDPETMLQLKEAFSAAGGGDAALGERGIALPLLDADGIRHVLHVLPLTSGSRRAEAKSYDAVAAVFVHRADLASTLPPEAIARAFGLTLSELRVLMGIVEAGGVAETAEALGIAESTVRTHLHRLFAKTGAARQADLVKIVAGFRSPVLG